jgi:predicted ATPase
VNFFAEVRRRKVFRVMAAYAVGGWLLVEIGSVVLPAFDAPPIVLQAIIALVALGAPIVLVMAWVFDLTPEGLVRTEAVADEADVEPDAAQDAPETRSSRKRMTILCAAVDVTDVEGGAADPEDLLEVQPRAMELCRKICTRFAGRIVPGRGGEILAYFGYPVAQEDDTSRAVRAGLALVEGIARLDATARADTGVALAARAGVHAGDVIAEVADDGPADTPAIVGVLPGGAAALMEMSRPGEVLMTADVYRVVQGYFAVEARGQSKLGANLPATDVYRALHESGARNRLETVPAAELAPLVGRDLELGLLLKRWETAQSGRGQVALITGDGGIGKSRVVYALKQAAAGESDTWLTELYGSSLHQNTALHPVRQFFSRDVLRFEETDDPDQQLARIEGLLAEYNQDLGETVPLVAGLMDVPLPDTYPPLGSSPQRQRQLTMELLVTLLLERADQQPVLFVVEDLHWCDPTTVELLSLLVGRVPAHEILCVFTARPAFEPPWGNASHISHISLEGLEDVAGRDICVGVTGADDLPDELARQIARKADGVPLYIEEITKTLLESGRLSATTSADELERALESIAPERLQEVLTARLDGLGSARRTAQVAATIGRAFSHQLISELAERVREKDLDDRLAVLVEAEILYRRGQPPRAEYHFKHALIQEAAYRLMLRAERRECHRAVAELLESSFPEMKEKQPELLALHYTRAGLEAAAVPYWWAAGQRAHRRSANKEAIAHFRHGLELLPSLPEGDERDQAELQLQTALGPALMAVKGYSAPEVEATYERAQTLCEGAGSTPKLVPVLAGLWAYHVVSGRYEMARQLCERLLEIGEGLERNDVALESHVFQGVTLMHLGDPGAAAEHLEKALAMHDDEAHAGHAYIYGQDPAMAARVYLGSVRSLQGDAAAADAVSASGIQRAREINHPHSLAFALGIAARTAVRHGEVERARQLSQEAINVADRFGFPIWAILGRIIQGWATARLGDPDGGLQQMEDGMTAYREAGSRMSRAYYTGLIAELYCERGDIEQALTLVEEALDESRDGDRHAEPEMHRLQGEFLLARGAAGDAEQAEAAFRDALRLAESTGAHLWRLRAAVSLARLYDRAGRRDEARAVLGASLAAADGGTGADFDNARQLQNQMVA